MARLLLVEDDDALAEALMLALSTLGHHVCVAATGEIAVELLSPGHRNELDLVLLDVMLGGMDGFEVCRRIRADSDIPVVLLTARGDPIDIVVGLEGGADDYIVKPAEPRVIDARVKAVLRRAAAVSATDEQPLLRIGNLSIDRAAMIVRSGEVELHLTPTELRLLLEFAQHVGQVLTRQVLLERVWEYGYFGDARIVDAAVARLRVKIEHDPAEPSLLVTVRGMGYRLVRP